MATNPLLVGTALLAGGAAAYALFKWWQAKNATAADDFCSGLCGGDATCLSLCDPIGNGVEQIVQTLDPFTDSEGAWKNQLTGDAKNNDELNGPIALHVATPDLGGPTPDSTLTGNTLLYQSECSPFFDTPG